MKPRFGCKLLSPKSLILFIMLVCLHFISSFFPPLTSENIYFSHILMIAPTKFGLIFSYISCGTTFQESTFCYIFRQCSCYILYGLSISLRPLPFLKTSLRIFYYLKFSRCQLFCFCHYLTFPH